MSDYSIDQLVRIMSTVVLYKAESIEGLCEGVYLSGVTW